MVGLMPITKYLETELTNVVARTALRVLGLDLLKNDAEAALVMTMRRTSMVSRAQSGARLGSMWPLATAAA